MVKLTNEEFEDIMGYLEDLIEGLKNKTRKITDKTKFVKGLKLTQQASEYDPEVWMEREMRKKALEEIGIFE